MGTETGGGMRRRGLRLLTLAIWTSSGLAATSRADESFFSLTGRFAVSSGAYHDVGLSYSDPSNPLTIRTLSYSGGTNLAGQYIYGGGIDSVIHLFDASGMQVAVNDDHDGTLDSLLSHTQPPGSPAYLAPQPAGDYRVRIRNFGAAVNNRTWSLDVSHAGNSLLTSLTESQSILTSLSFGSTGDTTAIVQLDAGTTMTVNGQVRVLDGGRLYSNGGTLNAWYVQVNGANALWASSGPVLINGVQLGGMRVEQGGTVVSSSASVYGAYASLDGAGSTWTTLDGLTIGDAGSTGIVHVNHGASLQLISNLVIGADAGSDGRLFVENGGEVKAPNGMVMVGYLGSGEMVLGDSRLLAHELRIAQDASASVTVTGSQAAITTYGLIMAPGSFSNGTLTVAGGAAVEANFFFSAYSATSRGDIAVSGAGSRLDVGTLTLAGEGSGSLAITDGAVVNAVTFGQWDNGQGTITIGGGSRLTAVLMHFMSGNVTATVDTGAVLQVTSSMMLGAGSEVIIAGGTVQTHDLEFTGGSIRMGHGTLIVGTSLPIDGQGVVFGGAAGTDILFGQNLFVGGTTTLLRPVRLDGGRLVTGDIVNGHLLQFASGTLGLMDDRFIVGDTGLLGSNVNIGAGKTLLASAGLTVEAGAQLTMAGGTLHGSEIASYGLIDGEGRINAPLAVGLIGEVRARPGHQLSIAGNAENRGLINLQTGTLQVSGQLLNQADGRINGRGTLMAGNLYNQGSINLSGGLSDVYGDVVNAAGGRIIVTGGGTATFYDTVSSQSGSEFRVSLGSTAIFIGPVIGAGAFTGSGIKIFESGVSVLGEVSTSGTTIVEMMADVTAGHFRESALTVNGIARIAPDGTAAGTSRVQSLTLAGGPGAWEASLDLADNRLIVQSSPELSRAVLAEITSMIASARNGGAGLWAGQGLTSGELRAGAPGAPDDPRSIHSLGVMLNLADGGGALMSSFGGQPVNASSILIMYTFNGDATLDGRIDGDDYFSVDAGYLHRRSGWQHGDFDYNGVIDAADYFLMDLAFLRQDAAGLAAFAATTSVPEPAAALLSLLVLGALGRRPRR
jgi:T5SS/PEP-CTERM-associated repeat protein